MHSLFRTPAKFGLSWTWLQLAIRFNLALALTPACRELNCEITHVAREPPSSFLMLKVSGFSSSERYCYWWRCFEAFGQPHLLVDGPEDKADQGIRNIVINNVPFTAGKPRNLQHYMDRGKSLKNQFFLFVFIPNSNISCIYTSPGFCRCLNYRAWRTDGLWILDSSVDRFIAISGARMLNQSLRMVDRCGRLSAVCMDVGIVLSF